jgi:hypothetical protein
MFVGTISKVYGSMVCCGEFVANSLRMYALYANSLVVERSDVLFQGGLLGGNIVSGIPKNSCALYVVPNVQ